jgi:hypothetical protein
VVGDLVVELHDAVTNRAFERNEHDAHREHGCQRDNCSRQHSTHDRKPSEPELNGA